ncbi:MAG: MFS transporter, partial [Erysipelotrichaceae bacterium]|nr:MFS transporter [Erysipelotrichaceae bacterium]
MKRTYLLVIICCCLYIGACTGTANAYGAFIVPLSEQMNALRGTVSLASTIYGIVSGLCAPLMLWAIRKYPLRYVMLVTAICSSLLTCSFGFMNNVYLYLASNVFKGVLNSVFSSTIIIIIIGNWFSDYRSSVSALALGFSGIAGALYSPLFSHMVNAYGLKAGFFTMAFFQLMLVLPAFLFLTLTPEEKNLTAFTLGNAKQSKKKEDSLCPLTFKVNTPVFYALCTVSILMALLIHINNHLNGFARSLGKPELGPLLVSSIMLGNLFFKFVAGLVCDKLGDRYGLYFGCATAILGCVIMLLSSNNTVLLVGAFILGTAYGNQITTSALIRHVYGNQQYADVFAAQSVPYGLMYFGSMIFGYIYDFTGSYRPCFTLGIILQLIALSCGFYILK